MRNYILRARTYVRTHKAQLATLVVLAAGAVETLAPGSPLSDALRALGALVGAA